MVVCLLGALLCTLAVLQLIQAEDLRHVGVALQQLQSELKQPQQLKPQQFHMCVQRLAANLSQAEQERVAHNVRWLETPKSALQLRQLQELLKPNSDFKLLLWLSYFWQLRGAQRLDSLMLQQFALTLRELRLGQSDIAWNAKLQNMLQALPRPLRVLLHSRRLCVLHDQEWLYVGPAEEQLQLGASNCSMWQTVHNVEQPHWLRLENECDKQHSIWFINILQQHANLYMLFTQPTSSGRCFCVEQQHAYYVDAQHATAACYWQLNDCSQLLSNKL